eukprot:346568-Pyramimonas_sp.AAC.1
MVLRPLRDAVDIAAPIKSLAPLGPVKLADFLDERHQEDPLPATQGLRGNVQAPGGNRYYMLPCPCHERKRGFRQPASRCPGNAETSFRVVVGFGGGGGLG